MIEVVRFRNFKALRNVDVKLGRFTVIVGPNASGKTSVLDGLRYLLSAVWPAGVQALLQRKLGVSDDYTVDEARSRGSSDLPSGPLSLRLEGTWQETPCEVAFNYWPGHQPQVVASSGKHVFELERLQGTSISDWPEQLIELQMNLASSIMLRIDPKQCARASYSEMSQPEVEYNGYGAASVIADTLATRSKDFGLFLETLRRIVPAIKDLRTRRAGVTRAEHQVISIDSQKIGHTVNRTYWGNEIELDLVGAEKVAARLASEGTLVVLALLTALFDGRNRKLLLLDDLERALHPKAQAELIRCLRELLVARPNLQIVATSHSPYLLDHFDPSEVRLMTVDDEGNASCASLDEHPDFERWKGIMTPGEFWSSVGEGWVKDVARTKHDVGGALRSHRRRGERRPRDGSCAGAPRVVRRACLAQGALERWPASKRRKASRHMPLAGHQVNGTTLEVVRRRRAGAAPATQGAWPFRRQPRGPRCRRRA